MSERLKGGGDWRGGDVKIEGIGGRDGCELDDGVEGV